MSIKRKLHAFVHPMDGMTEFGGKLTWGNAVLDVIIGGVILGFAIGLAGFIAMLVGVHSSFGSLGPLGMILGGAGIAMGAMMWVGAMIVTPIIAVIGWFIDSIAIWIIAKIIGGKGSFSEQTKNLGSLVIAPLMIIDAMVVWIPIVGAFLAFLVSLYSVYTLTVVLKETHKFSTIRAIISWFIGLAGVYLGIAVGMAGLLYFWIGGLTGGPSIHSIPSNSNMLTVVTACGPSPKSTSTLLVSNVGTQTISLSNLKFVYPNGTKANLKCKDTKLVSGSTTKCTVTNFGSGSGSGTIVGNQISPIGVRC